MTSAVPANGGAATMSIGQVLRQLREDFPDISVSKIRFLEAEGLITPERAPSGYRKFSSVHLDQLRYILAAQRDQYLPLRVIKEHLDAMARGLEPPALAGQAPRAPDIAPAADTEAAPASSPRVDLRMSRAELLANSGLEEEQLAQAEEFGLVAPATGTDHYDATALSLASTIARMAEFGWEPRHLRAFKTTAERTVGLIDQVVMSRQGDEQARARAAQLADELAGLAITLHAALVRRGLPSSR